MEKARSGLPIKFCAQAAGVSKDAVEEWRAKRPELDQELAARKPKRWRLPGSVLRRQGLATTEGPRIGGRIPGGSKKDFPWILPSPPKLRLLTM